jgi:hypothetical protein
MIETLLGLQRRRASTEHQQQAQQLMLEEQHLRVVLQPQQSRSLVEQQHRTLQLEVTMWIAADFVLPHSSLFGEAAVVLLQVAVAHHAVSALRSPLPLSAGSVVSTALDYCGRFLCVPEQYERQFREASGLKQQQQQLLAAAAGAPVTSEAAASDESAADAALAAAWDAVLHSEDVAQLAVFQVAAAALQLSRSSSSSSGGGSGSPTDVTPVSLP